MTFAKQTEELSVLHKRRSPSPLDLAQIGLALAGAGPCPAGCGGDSSHKPRKLQDRSPKDSLH